MNLVETILDLINERVSVEAKQLKGWKTFGN